MKTTKIVTIATIITIALITLFGIATASAESNTYKTEGIVTEWRVICADLYDVTVTTEDGNLFGFFADDEEPYEIGDFVVLTMKDMSEEHDEEDEVIDVEYINHFTPTECAVWLDK